ncbi:MAG: methyl-accepting chemotaxis protein [Desulfohalobiaceae bacterium]
MQFTIGKRVGLGFSFLILITLLLGSLGIWKMKNIQKDTEILAAEHVPEMTMAAEIREAANRLMYQMQGYGFTENDEFYARAQEEFSALDSGLEKGGILAQDAVHLEKLKPQLEKIGTTKAEYSQAMQETRATTTRLGNLRDELDKNALKYMQNSAGYLEGQDKAFKKDLREGQKKIELLTNIVDLGSEVRVTNFKAQAAGDMQLMEEAEDLLAGLGKYTDQLRQMTRDSEDIERIDDIETAAEKYSRSMQEYIAKVQTINDADLNAAAFAQIRKDMDAAASKYVNLCQAFLKAQQEKLGVDLQERHQKITIMNDIIDLGNDMRIKALKSQAERNTEIMEKGMANFEKIEQKFEDIRKITRLDADLKLLDTVQNAGSNYRESMGQFLSDWIKLQELGKERDVLGDEMIAGASTLQTSSATSTGQISKQAASTLSSTSSLMVMGVVAALVVGVLFAIFIARGLIKILGRISGQMDESADQVSAASGQVSAASQQLAEGASEQASSIEETSSSLEETSSMTKQNADNANQANTLMKEANQVVARANQSMTELTQSMQEISTASQETSKIIKTIDEIAFQTNLLALNAAVEAARAGEAGDGFAVVADEVRNLALRAAEAAKNTAELIEGTLKKVEDGSQLVSETNKAFAEVADSTQKVGDLVGEISSASAEQADGVEQINKAVMDLDKVVQQNAANAEESASASEELNAQAEQMKNSVADLVHLVGKSSQNGNGYKKSGKPKTQYFASAPKHTGSQPVANQRSTFKPQRRSTNYQGEVKPDQVIPMDEDFTDF